MMHQEVEQMLDRSPHPFKWLVIMLVLVITAIVWHNVFIGILAGVSIGAYFGNYRGRFAVLEAWRKQMHFDYDKRIAELQQAEYESLKAS